MKEYKAETPARASAGNSLPALMRQAETNINKEEIKVKYQELLENLEKAEKELVIANELREAFAYSNIEKECVRKWKEAKQARMVLGEDVIKHLETSENRKAESDEMQILLRKWGREAKKEAEIKIKELKNKVEWVN